ncbi:MAG TPA: tandem-95 repeat protein [Chitinophagaceae bacterium]|nr:tandem-95 repeat protein [Chitinophagaceae bacterium]
MKKPLTFLFSTWIILYADVIHASNYYFSSSGGNDSYTSVQAQNPATPWQSLNKLNSFFSSLQPGDSVLFKCGDTFYGNLIIGRSGSPGSPIVLASYGIGAKPIITGFSSVTSWTNVSGNIWESSSAVSSSSMLNMVIVSGAFQPIGRYPKLTDADSGYLTFQSHSGTSSITSSQIASAPSFTGGQVVIRATHWLLNKGTISSQTSTTVSYTPITTFTVAPTYEPNDNFGFFFQNHVNACTTQGDWYYNTSTKKIGMYSSGTPLGVKVAAIDTLVNLSSKSYLTFIDIEFTGANNFAFWATGASYITISNCTISYCGVDAIRSQNSSASHITVSNCNISYANNCGVLDRSSTYWTFQNDTITNIGLVAGMGVSGDGSNYSGTANLGDNSLFQYNILKNIGLTAMNFSGGLTIQYNYIDSFGLVLDDCAGIGCNTSPSSATIQNNIVLNGIGAPDGTPTGIGGGSANGIYIDDDSPNKIILNNTVAFMQQLGMEIHNSSNIVISANTLFNNGSHVLPGDNGGAGIGIGEDNYGSTLIRNLTMSNNILVYTNTDNAILRVSSINDDISSFGTFDNNYYCNPLINNPDLLFYRNPSGPNWVTLSGWQSFSGQDAHSKKSPKTITNVNDIRFEYNASSSPKTINLGATYIGVDSTIYSGSITLQPYSSAVLIYLSGTVANQPPVANAGPDQNFFLPTNSTTLTGSGSDADGSIASYQWTKISGPTQLNIVSPTQAQTVINNLVQGTYQFQLTVTDNLGATGKDTVVVTVNAAPNQAPSANAGPDQNITLPTNSISVTGSGNDPDGTIASYQWTKISGPSQYTIVSPTQAQTVINNLVQGTYQFQLTVTDNLGATGRDTVFITVNAAPNQAPSANAGTNQNITLPTNSVTIVGSGSDPDGSIASYQWTKISGPSQYTIVSPTLAQTVINNLVQGTYQFQLTVTDNLGATGKDTVVITVNAANIPPTANAGPDQNITLPTNSITVVGNGNDPDGTIASYQWSKISGPTQFNIVSPTQAQTVINNLVQGTYQFQLTVTDNLGATGKDTVVITVNAANIPPTANAGPDQNITLPTNSITVVGSGNDPDGNIASYQWTKISGPSQFTIVSPTQAQTVINNLVQGTYQFQLTVTDNQGATGKDTIQVVVNPANQPPVANAGPNQNITLPTNSVTLIGSANDPDGTIASYSWTKISGPTQFTIVSPSQAQTLVNNLVQGTYQFQLTVTDNKGATGVSTVTITVNAAPNQPPTANAGPDQSITLPTNSITLSGSGSDPDGTITAYKWRKISGPNSGNITNVNAATTTITGLVQGVYQYELRVTDNNGAYGRDTIQVTVNPANIAPTADAGPNQNVTLPTNSVTVSGSGADPDGTIVSYHWSIISGPSQYNIVSASQAQTVINNLVQGTYQFQLTVTDNQGATGTDIIVITVNAASNQPPVADAGPNQNITLPTNSVTLSGSGTDADGTVVSYSWTKVSGPTQFTIVSPTQGQTTVNGLVQGTYQFQLTVTDNQGATGIAIVTVTVNPAPNQPPVANAGTDQNITLPINSVTLSGNGNDPDGSIVSYQWSKISGPTQFSIISPTQAQTIVNNLVAGTYQFQLTVTDNSGATGTDVIIITVNPAPNQAPTANAGTDLTIYLPTNTVSLSGSGWDPDGTIASYQWTKISGPTQFIIVSPTQAQTVINNLVQGVYLFQLTVTDNQGATGKDTVQVTVNPANIAPTANAGPDENITLPTSNVTLFGSGNDPDGSIASYQWTKISGPTQFTIVSPTQAQTVINNLVQGVYQFQLTVTDNQGAIGKDTVVITVNAANIPPTANAGPNQNITLPTNSITLVGSGSDPDGTIASYQWTKISGPTQFTIVSPTQAQTVINNLVQGTYQFQLKVTDNQGATDTATVTVTVNPAPNQAPTANAGPNQNITLPTNSVTLVGSGSDPDGTIASYQWTKISGPTQFTIVSPTQAQTVINNLIQGTYQFQLKVTDNQGATGTATVTVTVNPAPNQPPIANAGPDQTITLPVNTVTLSGSGTDPDGTIVSYSWSPIAGPTQFTIVSPTQAQTAINNLVQGVYVFQLTVVDNSGATATDLVTVTVNAAGPSSAPTANAGSDQVIVLPVNSTTLAGSGTSPNGSISSYAWSQVSGPAPSTIASPSQSQTSVQNLVAGIYEFELLVTDNNGMTGRDTVQVTVENSPNRNQVSASAKLYPNPASTTINIEIDGATEKSSGYIKIYNSAGHMVYQEAFTRDQFTITKQIDVSGFAGGIYFVSVTIDANTQTTLKFVKQ